MSTYLRLFADADGHARFEDCELTLSPERPRLDQLGVSEPLPALAAFFVRAPAGGSHPEQPESRRQLVVGLSGSCTVTASGETRVVRPGDVLLVEDTDGVGHSSETTEGFTALMIPLGE
jgi:quercetin dioxygenase-like cupin family protein